MSQDVSKVLLGQSGSSAKAFSLFGSDPASFPAGSGVSLASEDALALGGSGIRIGVSMGRSLSDTKKTSVLRYGESVPMLAHLKRATGLVTITSFANLLTTTADTVSVAGQAFTAQSGAATPGGATFQAATSNGATAVSLAAQINAHAVVGLKVYAVGNSTAATVTLYSIVDGVGSTGTGNDIAVAYTDNGGGNIGATISGLSGGKLSGGLDTVAGIDYMTVGTHPYVNNATGKLDVAMTGFSTITAGVYVAPTAGGTSSAVTGVNEDSSLVPAGIVDMPGGL